MNSFKSTYYKYLNYCDIFILEYLNIICPLTYFSSYSLIATM